MRDIRDWIRNETGIKPTAEQIGEVLGVSRASATRRLVTVGLNAGEIIEIARSFHANPVRALVDLGLLSDSEVWSYFGESGMRPLSTYDDGDIVGELAFRMCSQQQLAKLARAI